VTEILTKFQVLYRFSKQKVRQISTFCLTSSFLFFLGANCPKNAFCTGYFFETVQIDKGKPLCYNPESFSKGGIEIWSGLNLPVPPTVHPLFPFSIEIF